MNFVDGRSWQTSCFLDGVTSHFEPLSLALRPPLSISKTILSAMVLFAVARCTPEESSGTDEESTLISRADLAVNRLNGMRGTLGLSEQHFFTRLDIHQDELGLTHTRMQQTYQGVPVWGGQVIAHADSTDQFRAPTLAHFGDINLDPTPTFTKAALLPQVIHALGLADVAMKVPQVELVVYPERELLPLAALGAIDVSRLDATRFEWKVRRFVLAYHVQLAIENPGDIRHIDAIVDANSGEIVKQWNSLQTANAVGVGNSQYSGTVSLNTNSTATGFALQDTSRPVSGGNAVYNLNHAVSGKGTLYTDDDNTWGDGLNFKEIPEPTTSPNGQTAAVDLAFGIQSAWDMYKNVLGRNGLDGKGTAVFGRVHYDKSYDNAFYDPTCKCITFGDGNEFQTLTSLDVTGHEFSHGVTGTSANLIYAEESGGLNEATSDIMGTMIEFYTYGANGQGSTIPDTGGNWTEAEDIATPAFPKNMRYLYKPSLDGDSADAWSPTLYTLDVHYSSGPMNRAFYFMSQGATTSGDTSSTFLPEGMTGIGNQKSAKIWYRALTTYLTQSSNYATARTAAIQAARDLYGASGIEEIAVWNAFAAINVGQKWDGSVDASPSVTLSVQGTNGTIGIEASASDDVGVAKVQFLIDGTVVATLSSPPYAMNYDTLLVDDGAHTIAAKATDNSGYVGTATQNIVVNNGQLLKNGSFERGYGVGWSNTPGMQIGKVSSAPAHDGTMVAKFCGAGASKTVSIYQNVSIAPDAGAASLTYALRIDTAERGVSAKDAFVVQVRNTSGVVLQTLAKYSNLNASAGYAMVEADLSAYRGQTIQVYFSCTEDAGMATAFILDRVIVRSE